MPTGCNPFQGFVLLLMDKIENEKRGESIWQTVFFSVM